MWHKLPKLHVIYIGGAQYKDTAVVKPSYLYYWDTIPIQNMTKYEPCCLVLICAVLKACMYNVTERSRPYSIICNKDQR